MDYAVLGTQPISNENPAGEDARYEPEYDTLQQEIEKLSNATAGGAVDWKQVVSLASSILAHKAKDVKVASWLAVGLVHLEQVEGLLAGTRLLMGLTQHFWDTLYPSKKRLRGRYGAIDWWAHRSEAFLKAYNGDRLCKDMVEQLVEGLTALDALLSEKFEKGSMLRSLIDQAKYLPVDEEEASASQPASSEGNAREVHTPQDVAEGALAPHEASTRAAGAMTLSGDYAADLKICLDALASLAAFLLVNEPANADGYRLRRLAVWTPIQTLPPAQNGQTRIPAPDSTVRDSLARQLEGGDFLGALQSSESRIGEYLFWLDMSRLSAEALNALGSNYAPALAALEMETGFYVRRMPELVAMSFADGTPFADAKTRLWLDSLGSKGGDGEPAGAATGLESPSDNVVGILEEAGRLASQHKLLEAVSLIQQHDETAMSCCERFRLQTGLAELLTRQNQPGMAYAHAKGLLDQVEHFHLETWDPPLALSGLMAAYHAVMALGGEDAAAQGKHILQRITRINSVEALKIYEEG